MYTLDIYSLMSPVVHNSPYRHRRSLSGWVWLVIGALLVSCLVTACEAGRALSTKTVDDVASEGFLQHGADNTLDTSSGIPHHRCGFAQKDERLPLPARIKGVSIWNSP
eukprot:6009850-Pyramimonas_sp.AAC.1